MWCAVSRHRQSDPLADRCDRCAHTSWRGPGYCYHHHEHLWRVWADCTSFLDGRVHSAGQLDLFDANESPNTCLVVSGLVAGSIGGASPQLSTVKSVYPIGGGGESRH